MKSPLLSLVLLQVLIVGILTAQPAKPPALPPPSAPWVAPVPERGEWLLVAVPDKPKPDPAAPDAAPTPPPVEPKKIRQITATSWNAVKKDVFHYSDNSKATLLYFAGKVLVEGKTTRGEAAPVLVHQMPGTDYSTLRSPGWLGLDWLSKERYVGVAEFKRAATPQPPEPEVCYHYRRPPDPTSEYGFTMPEVHAWIRGGDLQPVAVKIGSTLFEFQRLADPASPPSMTPEQAAKLLDLKDQIARMDKLRERNKRLRAE